ncbi:hypothetical protein BPS13_0046 [Bacillus phage BPS13]|uniref:Uncharacterized protein n=1 Tax=Bacillus phage BPS13 TaxID=1136731 RepID=J9PUS1_9CAUD|nr:hypothetical protein BPS13_0046 [Bacillus phage BPS13]AEZ50225.1 hypothetical protein BPS13_0046 [Bacillus phage BPS13]
MSQLTTPDAIMIFFLTWAQTFAYLTAIFVLCKGIYVTIQKLCGKLSIISRAGWCVLVVVAPALLCATAILAWDFLAMPADDIIAMYTKLLTP